MFNLSEKFDIFTIGKMSISLITLVLVSIVTYKALVSKHRVDTYEEYFFTIDSKLSTNVNVYYNDIVDIINNENDKNMQVKEYVNCINNKIDNNNLNDNIKRIINELESLYNQSYNYFSFKYMDIYTGFSISYNEQQPIFTASTIKAPANIYIYEQASMNKINLEEQLTYTASYYNTGSGILKTKSFNQNYTTRYLSSLAIIPSDNAAHNMLMDRYGRENMLAFWKEKGTNAIFTNHNNWGVVNAHDGVIYMNELYNFYLTNDEYGNELWNNFLNAGYKLITNKDGIYKTANKTGWSGSVIHDAAIVLEDNPYILVVLTNLGTSNFNYLFSKTSNLIGRLHEEYWNYKYDSCRKIIE